MREIPIKQEHVYTVEAHTKNLREVLIPAVDNADSRQAHQDALRAMQKAEKDVWDYLKQRYPIKGCVSSLAKSRFNGWIILVSEKPSEIKYLEKNTETHQRIPKRDKDGSTPNLPLELD